MAILRRAAVVAALVPIFGCQREPLTIDVDPSHITVHALLVANADSATVLLTRSRASSGLWEQSLAQPVTNAQVRLVHGTDTIALAGRRVCMRRYAGDPAQLSNSDGCYSAALPGGVRPGGTYQLLVDVPGSPAIRGTTQVPALPEIREPAIAAEPPVLRTFYPSESPTIVNVRWAGVSSDSRTELRFVTDRTDCQALIASSDVVFGGEFISVVGSDSARIAPAMVQCGQPLAAAQYAARLVVTMYDASYSRYIIEVFRSESVRLTHTSAGLTGAFGVFGGVASSAVPVVLSQY